MVDPLSTVASVVALIQLGQSAFQLLVQLYDEESSYSKEFKELSGEIRGLCGALCILKRVIDNLESGSGIADEGYPCKVLTGLTSRRNYCGFGKAFGL